MPYTFQNPATALMESMIDLHTCIMFYVVGIVFIVSTALVATLYEFYLFKQASYDALIVAKVVHCTWLELVWTVTPAVVLGGISIPSFAVLYALEERGDYNLTIKAVGHQWYWEYQCVADDGYSLFTRRFDSYLKSDEGFGDQRLLEVDRRLLLPLEHPIRVLTTSDDVIHSWALPAAGVKMDAIPGRLNLVNLVFNRGGVFFGQCSELCGVNHGFMPICVKVIPYEEYIPTIINTQ